MYIHNKFFVFVREYNKNIERKNRNNGPYPPTLLITPLLVSCILYSGISILWMDIFCINTDTNTLR